MQHLDTSKTQAFLNHHGGKIEMPDITFYIHYWGINPRHYSNMAHSHSYFEVCYVIDGSGEYLEQDNVYPISSNTIFLSRPGVEHQICSSSGLYLAYVAFDIMENEALDDIHSPFHPLRSTENFLKIIADPSHNVTLLIWQALISQTMQAFDLAKPIIYTLSYALLSSFIQEFAESFTFTELPNNTTPILLKQIHLFILDNLTRSLRMSDLSRHLHISERHLSRTFSEYVGESLPLYIRKQRIKKAAELLRSSNLSIKAISFDAGFDSIHYFTRIFKQEMGISPGKFRNNAMFS